MARYQVVYSKSQPAAVWCDTAEQAEAKAAMLRAVGYTVTIWEHTEQGARPYGKSFSECFGTGR